MVQLLIEGLPGRDATSGAGGPALTGDAPGPPRPRGATGVALACGAVGAPLFVLAILVMGATRPGYSAWRNAGSQLALGPGGWMQTVNFVVTGLLLVAFAVGLRRALPRGPGSVWGPRMIAAVGVGLLLAAVFPIAPGLGYPPGVPPAYTVSSLVHGLVVTVLLAGCLSAFCLVLARRFWGAYAAGSGVVVAVFYVATVVVASIDPAGTGPGAWDGLLQRVMLVTGFGFVTLVALRLLRDAR